MRRAALAALALGVVAAVVYVALPFEGAFGPCGSAIVEAWPDAHADGAWTAYVPDSVSVYPPGLEAAACDADARERVVRPLLALAVVGVALTGLLFVDALRGRRRG